MFKLLTEEQRIRVKSHYVEHRLVIMLEALVLILVVALVGLFPAYLLSNIRKAEINERLKIVDAGENKFDDSEVEEWLTQTKAKIKALDPAQDMEKPSEFIESVLDERYTGVQVINLDWANLDSKKSLTLTGIAKDRQTLITFESNLNGSGLFSEVSLPVSNLARDKDINFQLKLAPKKP